MIAGSVNLDKEENDYADMIKAAFNREQRLKSAAVGSKKNSRGISN
jgi:hypothetical protein